MCDVRLGWCAFLSAHVLCVLCSLIVLAFAFVSLSLTSLAPMRHVPRIEIAQCLFVCVSVCLCVCVCLFVCVRFCVLCVRARASLHWETMFGGCAVVPVVTEIECR